MTTMDGRHVWRWPIALGLALAVCNLAHASDADGESGFEGAFLTLSIDVVNDHLALQSFKVTPATRAAFIGACSHGKRIWIDSTAVPCASARAVSEGAAVQVEIPQDAGKAIPTIGYVLVSAKPVTRLASRQPNGHERAAMSGDSGTAAAAVARIHLTAAELDHARAVTRKDRTIVLVAHGRDGDGNRLTHVFSVTGSQVTYAGKLPDWPEGLIDIGGVPLAIINRHGDARIIQAFSTWPRVEAQMFAGEGG